MDHPDQSAEGDPICIDCGLCCDGTLHARTTVKPNDESAVLSCGLEIIDRAEGRFFAQPCPHFSKGCCSVYSRRPGVCRTYRCELLKQRDAGDVEVVAARDTIKMAKRLVAAVREIDSSAITPAQRSALSGRLRGQLALAARGERVAIAQSLLATAVLEHFLNRNFLKSKEQDQVPTEDAS